MYNGLTRGQFLVSQCINTISPEPSEPLKPKQNVYYEESTKGIEKEPLEEEMGKAIMADYTNDIILGEAFNHDIIIEYDGNIMQNCNLNNTILDLNLCTETTSVHTSTATETVCLSSPSYETLPPMAENENPVHCENNSDDDSKDYDYEPTANDEDFSDDGLVNDSSVNGETVSEEGKTSYPENTGNDIIEENLATKTTRKRKYNQGLQRQQNVEFRVHGQQYTGKIRLQGGKYVEKIRPARNLGPRCNHKVTEARQCGKKTKSVMQIDTSRTFLCAQINDEMRNRIHEEFWALQSWEAKHTYVLGLADRRNPYKRRPTVESTKKSNAFDCYLKNSKGVKVRVCRQFFLNTLKLGRDTFTRWMKTSIHKDAKESTNKPLKNADNIKKRSIVLEWLALLPKVPSHYCRSSSQRIYVESVFQSKSHMHTIYETWCKENHKKSVSRMTFISIMKNEKISIHKPRKDQCDTCYQYQAGNLTREIYEDHRKMKEEAREAKIKAKNEANENKLVVTMDLQSVLLCPKLLVSNAYYKQKLQVHNFTVYSLNDSQVYLYVWHEGEGGVTSNDFVSCIIDFITKFGQNYKYIILISDGCNYQNRNKVLASALANLANEKNVTIEQLILEKGHTMMEADSVHSTLEALFIPPICSPGDYVSRMRAARPKKPYTVIYVDHSFFLNYEALPNNYASIRPGKKAGDPVVTDIRGLLYLPTGEVKYKIRHTDIYQDLPQRRLKLRKNNIIPALYEAPLKIKKEKYQHLQELKLSLPNEYHHFYDSLSYN